MNGPYMRPLRGERAKGKINPAQFKWFAFENYFLTFTSIREHSGIYHVIGFWQDFLGSKDKMHFRLFIPMERWLAYELTLTAESGVELEVGKHNILVYNLIYIRIADLLRDYWEVDVPIAVDDVSLNAGAHFNLADDNVDITVILNDDGLVGIECSVVSTDLFAVLNAMRKDKLSSSKLMVHPTRGLKAFSTELVEPYVITLEWNTEYVTFTCPVNLPERPATDQEEDIPYRTLIFAREDFVNAVGILHTGYSRQYRN